MLNQYTTLFKVVFPYKGNAFICKAEFVETAKQFTRVTELPLTVPYESKRVYKNSSLGWSRSSDAALEYARNRAQNDLDRAQAAVEQAQLKLAVLAKMGDCDDHR
jgi:hypothetical protein